MPGSEGEVSDEVFIVGAEGVMMVRILHTGVEHTGFGESIVGEELTEARKPKFILQLFSFINQTLHLR